MPAQFWESHISGPPPSGANAGAAYNTSTTLTDVSTAPQITLPANFLNYPGASLRMTAFGTFSNTSTPTLLLGFYYGGVAGVSLGNTGAFTTVTGASSWSYRAEMTASVRATGSSGTIWAQGIVYLQSIAWSASATDAFVLFIPNAALAAVTVDTTAAKAITLGAQWGTSSASNTLTNQSLLVESIV